MEQSIAKTMLQQVYNEITANESKFIEWNNYKLAEVSFPELEGKIGIGLKSDNSEITLFYIEAVNYGPDYKKYISIIQIGQSAALVNKYWNIQLGFYNLSNVKTKEDFLVRHYEAVAKPILRKINELETN